MKQPRALVLGGTAFVGRHLVEALLADGWAVTLFNRGRTNPGLFDGVTRLVGDRDHDVSALVGGTWDVVFDTAAYLPRQVDLCAQLLAERTDHYVFVSSISVYATLPEAGMDEDAPLATLDGPIPDEMTGQTYGALKALCEHRVAQHYPSHTIVRPTLIVGPHDPTDRFTYWPLRLREPGRHVVPSNLDAAVQYIDVRDLTSWMGRLGAQRVRGTFNAASPPSTFEGFLKAIARAVATSPDVVKIDPAELAAEGVRPWLDLPVWLSPTDADRFGMLQVSTARATSAGLSIRPMEDTVRDTVDWALQRAAALGPDLRAGLTPEREAALLAGR